MSAALRLLAALAVLPAAPPSASAQVAAAPAATPVPVLARAVAKGELLAADDFTIEERSPAQARGGIPAREAMGKEAARNLPLGTVLRASDVIVPRLVRRGEPVMINVRSGGLTIATAGRALGSGANGDLVRVVSLSTNRTLDGVVEGPSAVRVTAP